MLKRQGDLRHIFWRLLVAVLCFGPFSAVAAACLSHDGGDASAVVVSSEKENCQHSVLDVCPEHCAPLDRILKPWKGAVWLMVASNDLRVVLHNAFDEPRTLAPDRQESLLTCRSFPAIYLMKCSFLE